MLTEQFTRRKSDNTRKNMQIKNSINQLRLIRNETLYLKMHDIGEKKTTLKYITIHFLLIAIAVKSIIV